MDECVCEIKKWKSKSPLYFNSARTFLVGFFVPHYMRPSSRSSTFLVTWSSLPQQNFWWIKFYRVSNNHRQLKHESLMLIHRARIHDFTSLVKVNF
ncbi:unnamed protein product [Allacma fusca]|uniref:Uncharacterized protein n=1 Tax=Allacma fusca TaxID=39272 RepID=A0A8J2L658_9HEXA|nr:unnamed protein product [Allacma fusca]